MTIFIYIGKKSLLTLSMLRLTLSMLGLTLSMLRLTLSMLRETLSMLTNRIRTRTRAREEKRNSNLKFKNVLIYTDGSHTSHMTIVFGTDSVVSSISNFLFLIGVSRWSNLIYFQLLNARLILA